MMRPSSKTSSDHSHPGCCGDKTQVNVKLVRDGCCGESNKKPEGDMASSLSSCKMSTHVKHDLKMKGSSSCCANKNEKMKEVVAKSCCEKPKQLKESSGDCRSGHCEEKKHTEEIVLLQTGLEIELQRKDGETSKSSCCDNKEIVKETGLLLIEEEGSCKSSCCDDEIQTAEVTIVDCCENKETVKQSCHEKTGLKMEAVVRCDPKLVCCGNTEEEMGEQSDMEIKIEEQCKSGCCNDEKQTGEITLASEEDSDSSDCSTRCCEDKEGVTQICNEKHVVSGLETEGGGDCKSLCCETGLKQVSSCCSKEGVPIQSPTDLVLSDLQVKKDEHCETSERAIKVETCCKVKKDEHCETSEGAIKVETCCKVKKDEHCETSEGAIKVETCCKVKTPEACGSKCREREKRHSGKSCCRSYAKEYCSHRHHHHHHNHHHNHVRA
ncbi:putative cadmium/zinc-transporting ATPase HMA4 [Cardamine amara subsp. amara]|uniref:Cadmium/zinc-transporting ATPase HMA4 n=1 Tax=Cardamine amara subsp. amara TaxID=228776 RepID=A0ABD1BMG2_CARAN